MILADPRTFTREHYQAHRGIAPLPLCELVVHCLELVSQLAHDGLAFRFKGGNSLLVLLEAPERFSIDVDIVTTAPREELVARVERIAARCERFTRVEARAPRTKPWLPMISFKLFFRSDERPPEEAYVMLDCVLEAAPYPGNRRTVRCGELYDSGVEVEVPSPSGLLGDKLLAIGPAALGIPLGKRKEAQRLKHVFDVALLARRGHDPAEVRASALACLSQENRMQGRACTLDEVVRDTRAFCRAALEQEARPEPDDLPPGYLEEIVRGFDEFRRHLFRMDYTWSSLRDDCRVVSEVASALRA